MTTTSLVDARTYKKIIFEIVRVDVTYACFYKVTTAHISISINTEDTLPRATTFSVAGMVFSIIFKKAINLSQCLHVLLTIIIYMALIGIDPQVHVWGKLFSKLFYLVNAFFKSNHPHTIAGS